MSKERRQNIRKKQNTKKFIPLIAVAVAAVIIISAVAITCIHKCDDCSAFIFGKGYYKEDGSAGVLSSVFGTIFGDTESIEISTVEDVIICRECAMNNTSVTAELRNVSDFKR